MDTVAIIILIAAVILIAVASVVMYRVGEDHQKKVFEEKVGTAEQKSREIIDDALKQAESTKREALLEVKEESLRSKNELEKEIRERRAEISKNEKRIQNKEEALDKKAETFERREQSLTAREENLQKKHQEADAKTAEITRELERISGFTSEQAKEHLLRSLEDDVKVDAAKLVREYEMRAKDEASKKAQEVLVTAIQRCAADHVAESTITVVQIPSDSVAYVIPDDTESVSLCPLLDSVGNIGNVIPCSAVFKSGKETRSGCRDQLFSSFRDLSYRIGTGHVAVPAVINGPSVHTYYIPLLQDDVFGRDSVDNHFIRGDAGASRKSTVALKAGNHAGFFDSAVDKIIYVLRGQARPDVTPEIPEDLSSYFSRNFHHFNIIIRFNNDHRVILLTLRRSRRKQPIQPDLR